MCTSGTVCLREHAACQGQNIIHLSQDRAHGFMMSVSGLTAGKNREGFILQRSLEIKNVF